MYVFAAFMDVRYETKGTFTPSAKYSSRSYREFIGYVIVARDSTLHLTVNESLRHFIHVLVLLFCSICYSAVLLRIVIK